jgi:uncharacterized membrane protein
MNNKYHYIEAELLRCLAKLHLITHDQLFKFLAEFDQVEVSDALNSLVYRGLLSTKDVTVTTATKESITVKLYYLNSKSRVYIKKMFPSVARYLREKCFSAINRQRIYHDLLIVESLIYMKKAHNIVDFWSEEELKGLRVNCADLRILIENDGEDDQKEIDIEIVVTNKRKHIERKSANMIYFTPIKFQQDVIEAVHKAPVILLDLTTRKPLKLVSCTTLDSDDILYIEQLEAAGGALTANALALILNEKRETISAKLAELERENYIVSGRVHLKPGATKGSRTKLYSIDEYRIDSLNDRQYALLVSVRIEEMFTEGWFFLSFDRFKRVIKFVNKDNVTHSTYLDDVSMPVIDVVNNYFQLSKLMALHSFKFGTADRKKQFNDLKKQYIQKAVA